ncbi:hypothetical protein LCGC14_1937640 [marine sediment metagenome]|uniref:Uncharacterized protein n=1 Tax=marine sediment metagenome TaxID=412755 RepID=A0A0F9IIL3_9ZZZZ
MDFMEAAFLTEMKPRYKKIEKATRPYIDQWLLGFLISDKNPNEIIAELKNLIMTYEALNDGGLI